MEDYIDERVPDFRVQNEYPNDVGSMRFAVQKFPLIGNPSIVHNKASCWISVKWIKKNNHSEDTINQPLVTRREDRCTSSCIIEEKSAITEDCNKYNKKRRGVRAANIAKKKKNEYFRNQFLSIIASSVVIKKIFICVYQLVRK